MASAPILLFGIIVLLLSTSILGSAYNETEGINNTKLLFLACIKGNLKIVKVVVETLGADIEAILDDMGNTALLYVSLEGKADIARYLLSRGANIGHLNGRGYSALHCSAAAGHPDMCELLLTAGADVNLKMPADGNTPLMEACTRKEFGVAKCLVEKGGADIEAVDESGHTALTHASFSGQAELVRYLLAHGAKTDGTDIAGASALHYAVFGRSLDVCKVLVDAGINVHLAVTKSGITAFHAAHHMDDLDIVKFFVEESGIDIETRDASGKTVLMGAAYEGQADIVQYLLTKNARTDWKNEDGDTALDIAAKRGHTEVVEIILRASQLHSEL